MPLLGWPELVLILVIVVIVFGASRLKGLGKAIGESIREFKQASSADPPKTRKEEEKEAIDEAARKMGVNTRGKSVEQILNEMNKVAKESGAT